MDGGITTTKSTQTQESRCHRASLAMFRRRRLAPPRIERRRRYSSAARSNAGVAWSRTDRRLAVAAVQSVAETSLRLPPRLSHPPASRAGPDCAVIEPKRSPNMASQNFSRGLAAFGAPRSTFTAVGLSRSTELLMCSTGSLDAHERDRPPGRRLSRPPALGLGLRRRGGQAASLT
jgi:hypothetical protein